MHVCSQGLLVVPAASSQSKHACASKQMKWQSDDSCRADGANKTMLTSNAIHDLAYTNTFLARHGCQYVKVMHSLELILTLGHLNVTRAGYVQWASRSYL